MTTPKRTFAADGMRIMRYFAMQVLGNQAPSQGCKRPGMEALPTIAPVSSGLAPSGFRPLWLNERTLVRTSW